MDHKPKRPGIDDAAGWISELSIQANGRRFGTTETEIFASLANGARIRIECDPMRIPALGAGANAGVLTSRQLLELLGLDHLIAVESSSGDPDQVAIAIRARAVGEIPETPERDACR